MQRLDKLPGQMAQGVLYALEVDFYRHLPMVAFRDDRDQPARCLPPGRVPAEHRCTLGWPRSRPGAEQRADASGQPHSQRTPEGDAHGAHRHTCPTHARRHPTQEREGYQ